VDIVTPRDLFYEVAVLIEIDVGIQIRLSSRWYLRMRLVGSTEFVALRPLLNGGR